MFFTESPEGIRTFCLELEADRWIDLKIAKNFLDQRTQIDLGFEYQMLRDRSNSLHHARMW